MPQLQPESRAPGRFPTTQWSRVATAANREDGEGLEALSMLCQAYWYPIYAFVRNRGFSPEQAQDRTQDFFAYVLERDLIARADPARGRFRAFLRTVCARHLAGDRDRDHAAKRGGGRLPLAIDPLDAERRYGLEPTHEMTAERIFDRTWALTLLGRVVDRLRREYDDSGRSDKFEVLITVLTRDPASCPYPEIARRLGTTEGNIRVAVHRLRRRYGLLLREEIAATVGDAAQVDDEIQALFAALEG
ncbi:RNA polymerase sigma factor [Singulisphaera acidiphila]|uniref:DNA-directed RNA polymerase specialized sigma subunit, sigma24 n=1 Tax=Singulisphaera acidiphila (strain ATCC BAA-1392 / DSM 18658 / VKM B-2454 / MOB10) TaxID=886293 RepID=L0DDW3_SINAD|nr:sigma-70 family RNA polymerase sigma factor [Singulisphaera acidiphila]AGA27055.1 DNA-directed RNA polymerase specialized sigma subunit, sigma24 [Singulisphaera acidiphila DSM 18658]